MRYPLNDNQKLTMARGIELLMSQL